jgi:hypothetical protein
MFVPPEAEVVPGDEKYCCRAGSCRGSFIFVQGWISFLVCAEGGFMAGE